MLRMFLQVSINQLKESCPALPKRRLLRRLHVDPVQNLQKVEKTMTMSAFCVMNDSDPDSEDAGSDDDGINHNDRNHPNERRLKCTDCDATFQSWHQLLNHRTKHRGEIGRHAVPWEIDPTITPSWIEVQEDGSETITTPLRVVYQEYLPTITAGHDNGQVWGIYHFPVNNFNGESENLFHHLNHIYETENTTFRINLAFGVILRNEEMGQYRYYLPYYNSTLLDFLVRINNRNDLIKFFRRSESLDLIDLATKTRG